MKEMKMFATILTGSLVPPPPPPGPMVRQQNPPSLKSKSHTHVLMGEKQAPLQVTKSWFGTGNEPLDFCQGSNIATWMWKTQWKHHISEMSLITNSIIGMKRT